MSDKALYILAGYDEETDNRLTDMQNRAFPEYRPQVYLSI